MMNKNDLKKNILFSFTTLISVVLIIELLSFFAFSIIQKRWFSFSRIHDEQRSLTQEEGANNLSSGKETKPGPDREVIHPYLGFVLNPELSEYARDAKNHNNIPISDYGFRDVTSPIHTKSNEKIIIGIFGGSVAFWFSAEGIDSLTKELGKFPPFLNKEIVIVRTALGGYKQPQQLMALNYLLVLGAQFDIVINIDGFNEVALPLRDNISKNVFPFFPRNWFMRVQGLHDTAILSAVGEITYLRSKRREWAKVFVRAPFSYSVTLNLIWKYYDRSLAITIAGSELTLQSQKPQKINYVSTGPRYHYDNKAGLYKDLASVWKRSSLQIHGLCAANGIKYIHFLQPNQYLAGSKIMGEEERKQAYLENHPYKRGVEGGYRYLIEAGNELVNEGVSFHDLTMIFSDEIEPIYRDTCCHVNKRGNDILGTVIAKAIIQDFNTDITGKRETNPDSTAGRNLE